jgi:hypothetical protein
MDSEAGRRERSKGWSIIQPYMMPAVAPPSTASTEPVTNDACSPARYRTASAGRLVAGVRARQVERRVVVE